MKSLYLIIFFTFAFAKLSIAGELSQENKIATLNDDLTSSLTMTIVQPSKVAPGSILLTPSIPKTGNLPAISSLVILDNVGKVLNSATATGPRDLKFTKEGKLQFLETVEQNTGWGTARLVYTDATLKRLDTFQWKNQFKFGFHDAITLRNGNRLIVGFDADQLDISGLFPNGRPDYDIQGSFIQEITPTGKVVFQWRSFDNIPLSDSYNDYKVNNNSYSHINSIDEDYDGNFVASFRNLSQIIKINRITGDIMWIMGGKKNQFEYIDFKEASGGPQVSFQHDVRMLGDNVFSVLDNGNQYKPPLTKAKFIKIDEANKKVTLLKEYSHPNKLYTSNQGNVQLLPNGNTMLSWGSANNAQTIAFTEVDANFNIVLQGELPRNTANYRVFKQDLDECNHPFMQAFAEFKQGNTYSVMQNNAKFVDIKVDIQKGFLYNNMEFTHSNCIGDILKFEEGREPAVVGGYFKLQKYQTDEFETTLTFNFDNNTQIAKTDSLALYLKVEGDSVYRKLGFLSSPDGNNRHLRISGVKEGRFVLGFPASGFALPKISQMLPSANALKKSGRPIDFSWNVQGSQISTNILQIVRDVNKIAQTEVLNDTLTSTITSDVFNEAGDYFWRIIATNPAGTTVGNFRKFTVSNEDILEMLTQSMLRDYKHNDTIQFAWLTNLNPNYKLTLIDQKNTEFVVTDAAKNKTGKTILIVDTTKLAFGLYKCKLDAEGKSITTGYNIQIGLISDVATENLNTNFEVYPNPTNDIVTINSNDNSLINKLEL